MYVLKRFLRGFFFLLLTTVIQAENNSCCNYPTKKQINDRDNVDLVGSEDSKEIELTSVNKVIKAKVQEKGPKVECLINIENKGYTVDENAIRVYYIDVHIRNVGSIPIESKDIVFKISPRYQLEYTSSEGTIQRDSSETTHDLKSSFELEQEELKGKKGIAKALKKTTLWFRKLGIKAKKLYLKTKGERVAKFPIKPGQSTRATILYSVAGTYVVLMKKKPLVVDIKLCERNGDRIGREVVNRSIKFTPYDPKLPADEYRKYLDVSIDRFSLFFFWGAWVLLFI